MRAVIGKPIVVGAEPRGAQFAVLHLKQAHPEARVQPFADHAVAILTLDARDRIPGARSNPRIATRHPLREIFRIDAGDRKACNRERTESFGDEEIALALAGALDDSRRAIEKALLDSRGPYVGRLDHMRIRGQDSLRFHRRSPLL